MKSNSICVGSLFTDLYAFFPASQPEVRSVTDLIETVNEISKLSIAHEIVVNQDFYMEDSVLPPNRYQLCFFHFIPPGICTQHK